MANLRRGHRHPISSGAVFGKGTTTMTNATNDISAEHTGPVVSSQDVEGVLVFDRAGKRLGTIDHLVIERASGRVLSVVIAGSGFVGLGHAHFQVPWASLHYNKRRHAFDTDALPRAA